MTALSKHAQLSLFIIGGGMTNREVQTGLVGRKTRALCHCERFVITGAAWLCQRILTGTDCRARRESLRAVFMSKPRAIWLGPSLLW